MKEQLIKVTFLTTLPYLTSISKFLKFFKATVQQVEEMSESRSKSLFSSIIVHRIMRSPMHYVRFSRFYWHFMANLVMHICSMLQVRIIAIWTQGLNLNSGKSYATFGTKIPVFSANLGCLLGTKWQKWWIYENVSRIVKIIHSEA